MEFAKKLGIILIVESIEKLQIETNSFDAVLLIDVLEHHPKPRDLLNKVIALLKPNGLLLIEVPNSALLAKRLLLLLGKSNYPNIGFIFFNVGAYRGHIREYTIQEIKWMLMLIGCVKVKAETTNHGVFELIYGSKGLKTVLMRIYSVVSNLKPSFRSTITAYARKPEDWHPLGDLEAVRHFKIFYPHISKYNLDNESEEALVERLRCNFNGENK